MTSTTITSYLKQVRKFYINTIKILSFSDINFPKNGGSTTEPNPAVLKHLNYSMDVLANYYRGIGKRSIQTQFDQRLLDSERVVDLKTLDTIMDKPRTELPGLLSALEKIFSKSIKNTKMAPKIDDKTIKKLWKQTTTSLCAVIMYDTKCRVGVVQNLQIAEYIKTWS